MKTYRIFSMILLSTVLLGSCDWHTSRTIIGSGDVISEERPLSSFTGLSVTGQCNVDLTIGESFFVELHAQSQVLEVLTTRVNNGILEIGFDPDYNVKTYEEISATIVLPALNFIALTGTGDFTLSGEKQSLLDIHITGAGSVEAFDMEVDDCNITIAGTGNCEVSVNESLSVSISGVGNVFYKGSPELYSDISGMGKVLEAGR